MPQQPCILGLIAAAVAASALCSCGTEAHARVLRKNTLPETTPAPQAAAAPLRAAESRPGGVHRNETVLRSGGTPTVHIHLARQRGELLLDGQVAMDFPVCTGRQNSTPEGTYHILEKDPRHRSNLYHVAMPYFMRLTYDGIGLHVGDVYSAPVSHGCIRLTREACVPLYRLLPVGTPVLISRS